MTRSWFLPIALVACHASPAPRPAADPLQPVLAYLESRDPAHAAECWSFATEAGPGDYVAVDVRDKHGGACGGDPGVEPIIDRLRVHADGSLQRYDVIHDTWPAAR